MLRLFWRNGNQGAFSQELVVGEVTCALIRGFLSVCFGEGLTLTNLWGECLVYMLDAEGYLNGFSISS
jgi:hypothetical protein